MTRIERCSLHEGLRALVCDGALGSVDENLDFTSPLPAEPSKELVAARVARQQAGVILAKLGCTLSCLAPARDDEVVLRSTDDYYSNN